MECETSRSSDGHFETRVYEPRVPIDARHGLGSPFTRDGSQEGASPPSIARTANRPRRLAPILVYARSFPRSSLLADHDTPPHRPQLEAYRRAKERRAEEAIRRARERRAGAPVPLEEHAANDRARRVPTADSGASSSGWRRASVAGQSSRRGRDRACERTVADISSLRAFTGLLDAAATTTTTTTTTSGSTRARTGSPSAAWDPTGSRDGCARLTPSPPRTTV